MVHELPQRELAIVAVWAQPTGGMGPLGIDASG
jgi:hypothetical protein